LDRSVRDAGPTGHPLRRMDSEAASAE